MSSVTYTDFIEAAKNFIEISNRCCDGWKFIEHDKDKCYLRKETFLNYKNGDYERLLKADYVIFYKESYCVPSFSFNVWNSAGMLLSLDDIRTMSLISINKKDFYSVVTQQEHPIFQRPYFIIHPCHTESVLAAFKDKSKNIIVTFLGLVCPLLNINLPLEYGM
ncbi:ubiquitin-like-conjugating enzyme ATG10 [Bombyx mandarina]|uniref:Ubiquitin-like-conjugating enzyme ATG10 n=2 Tax=Bombyx TaxID=7090 RepID=A0A8R2AGU2_BOMMO|nr:ubiquitin-like-conjugating enzyme ATG10 [Bombyx mori]XP_028037954.1 ubiquitin-like-conjugating enzyme ATG10 [Bombyx mandarina]